MSITMLRFILLILIVNLAFAFEDPKKYPDLDEKFYSLSITEPDQKVGYHVGDLVQRHIKLIVHEPYALIEESLPIVGYEKRFRGQLLGITLQNIDKKINKNELDLLLTYQIFTNNVVAKPAFVTADYYRVVNKRNSEEVLKLRIPELTIAVSPIAIFGDIKVQEDMSGLRGPILIEHQQYLNKIFISSAVFILSLCILLYIYTKFTILPGFKKTFLPLYRTLKKDKKIKLDEMIKSIHSQINNYSEMSIFEKNIKDLYLKNSSFKLIEKELVLFFKISNQKLFTKKMQESEEIRDWLIFFCFHLHLCEKNIPVKNADIKLIKI
jgi:mxaA protein